jgi:hypothetical protein
VSYTHKARTTPRNRDNPPAFVAPLPPRPTPHPRSRSLGSRCRKKKATTSLDCAANLGRTADTQDFFASALLVPVLSLALRLYILIDFCSFPLQVICFPKVVHRLSTARTPDNPRYSPIPQGIIRRFLSSSSALSSARALT